MTEEKNPAGESPRRGPLTKKEVDALVYQCRQAGDDSTYALVRAIEAAHNIGADGPRVRTLEAATCTKLLRERWLDAIPTAALLVQDVQEEFIKANGLEAA